MKYYYSLTLAMIFVTFTAFYCGHDEDPPDNGVDMVELIADNMNFEGEKAFISDEPIKKEAFIIGLNYMVQDTVRVEGNNASRPKEFNDVFYKHFDLKVISNTDFNAEYPEGSDVTKLFLERKLYRSYLDSHEGCLILRGIPVEGEHSFTVQAIFSDTIIEAKTNLVKLY